MCPQGWGCPSPPAQAAAAALWSRWAAAGGSGAEGAVAVACRQRRGSGRMEGGLWALFNAGQQSGRRRLLHFSSEGSGCLPGWRGPAGWRAPRREPWRCPGAVLGDECRSRCEEWQRQGRLSHAAAAQQHSSTADPLLSPTNKQSGPYLGGGGGGLRRGGGGGGLRRTGGGGLRRGGGGDNGDGGGGACPVAAGSHLGAASP